MGFPYVLAGYTIPGAVKYTANGAYGASHFLISVVLFTLLADHEHKSSK
jgi:hypothetical protein